MTRVLGAVGVSCTVTAFAALTAMVTGPSGVFTEFVMTHVSVPGAQTLAALAGDAARTVIALTVSPAASRSEATRRPGRLRGRIAGSLARRCGVCDMEELRFIRTPSGADPDGCRQWIWSFRVRRVPE